MLPDEYAFPPEVDGAVVNQGNESGKDSDDDDDEVDQNPGPDIDLQLLDNTAILDVTTLGLL